MTGIQHEHRRWTRYSADHPVLFTSNGKSGKGQLRDISAGGAAFDMEDLTGDSDRGELSIDGLGTYETQIIRDMEDGFAVMLSLDDREQSALQEELSDYFPENNEGYD